jgi:DNA-nicking Smr family endonuclease
MKPPKDKIKVKKKKGAATPEDDQALWQAVTKTVKPLKKRPLPPQDTGAQAQIEVAPAPPKRAAARSAPPALPAPPPVLPPPLPELAHGSQPGLDKATAKRLRRGQVQIEARIDLHGMVQDEARLALERFIESAWYEGKREVLVITGKGTRADGAIGVLRQAAPRWLNAAPNRARITAFTHAAAKDGGEGALYVRIKRRS